MDIKRDSNFVLFQAARATVSPAYFLCVFKHDLPHVNDPDIRVAIAQSTGDISGPLVLNLMETGSAIAVNGQVDLYAADWKLKVYEQTSSTNIDPAGAGRVVWSELVRVYDPPGGVTPRPPYDPCTNCGGGGGCDLGIIVIMNGIEVVNVTGLDPCVDNDIDLT